MKQAIISLLLLVLMSGCVPRGANRLGRAPITPAVDSLSALMDHALATGQSDDSLRSLLDEIERCCADSTPLGVSRLVYYRESLRSEQSDTAGQILVTQALSRLDSATYTYDYMRLKSLEAGRFEKSPVKAFAILSETAAYWKAVGDSTMLISDLHNIGRLMWNIGEYKRSLEYGDSAIAIARATGSERELLRMLSNRAVVLNKMGKRRDAQAIMRNLAGNEALRNDTSLYYDFCCNATELLGNPAYLDTARRLYDVRQHPDKVYFVDYLTHVLHQKDPEVCDIIDRRLWNVLDSLQSPEMRWMVIETHYLALRRHGDAAGALRCLEEMMRLRDSIDKAQQTHEVINLERRRELHTYKALTDTNRRMARMKIAFTAIIVALIVAAVAIAVWRYIERMKRQSRQRAVELSRERKSLVASMSILDGKNNMLEKIEEKVRDLESRGNIGHSDALSITSAIQLHKSGREEDDKFIESFQRLHPHFFTRMRESYPTLTAAQLKLGAYLVMGMTSKQVCRMLLIQPDAVKKRRYRLRQSMGLSSEESLEDELHRIADSCN